ncbi:hypothetical protein [Herbiconiux daphne]|uniref:Squalene cyclase C-terminal domain-containing protein n=1 Tax=Herbiconiux daphne TaxID=2970914 RepID=A0ABT2H5P7_9MICO|nr:hypothetical protein [Herbiconiux daphne]MCS5735213.1 hypothetical protein [Herbiconiux daphne]
MLRDQGAHDRAQAERHRIATEGWGSRLLATSRPDGSWGGDHERDRWRYALYTLHLLRELGVDPADARVREAVDRTRLGFTWGPEFGDSPFFDGEEEACINGRVLAIGASFGVPSDALAARLVGEQLNDGGWNCDAPPSIRSSFHSTVCVLEGLLAYEEARTSPKATQRTQEPAAGGHTDAAAPAAADDTVRRAREARRRGEEYLLERGLLRSKTTGELIDPSWARFGFPPNSDFDVLRGLEHLRAADRAAGTRERATDPRIAEAVQLVRDERRSDGRWLLYDHDLSHQHVVMETPGEPSRWVTLRARRVLDWAEPRPEARAEARTAQP